MEFHLIKKFTHHHFTASTKKKSKKFNKNNMVSSLS